MVQIIDLKRNHENIKVESEARGVITNESRKPKKNRKKQEQRKPKMKKTGE